MNNGTRRYIRKKDDMGYRIASFRSLIFHNVWEYFGIAQLYKLNDVGYFTLFSDMNMGMRTTVGYFMGYIYIYIYISIRLRGGNRAGGGPSTGMVDRACGLTYVCHLQEQHLGEGGGEDSSGGGGEQS